MSRLKKTGKWVGITLLVLLALLLVSYTVMHFVTEGRINKVYAYEGDAIAIPTDSLSILKGAHLYQIRGCQDCHGKHLEGSVFMNDPVLMEITAPNLTKGLGGLPADYSTKDWIRVLRHGTNRDGHSLMMMPSQEFYQLTDEDLANLIAFCTAQEPVNYTVPTLHSIGPVGRLLMTLDQVTVLPAERIDHEYLPPAKREEMIGIATGKYLSTGCEGCHRGNMEGGGPLAPGFPPVPDITSKGHMGIWSEEAFIHTLQTGVTPEGKALDNQYMPWQSIRRFKEEELRSIYQYLKSLPAKTAK